MIRKTSLLAIATGLAATFAACSSNDAAAPPTVTAGAGGVAAGSAGASVIAGSAGAGGSIAGGDASGGAAGTGGDASGGAAGASTACSVPADVTDLKSVAAAQPHLSDWCLFDVANGALVPKDPALVPYDLNTPLFSDYTLKSRFIRVPAGQTIAYDATEVLDFPVGTIIAKTFSYADDYRDTTQNVHRIETRLLFHGTGGWLAIPYVWNADESDADITLGGDDIPLTWIATDGSNVATTYGVPDGNECKKCHEIGAVTPIGPKARNLNRDYDYGAGPENQLTHWTTLGILTGAPSDPTTAPKLPVWNDPTTGTVEARARAYLEVNCAHCHSDQGTASTTGLDLLTSITTPHNYGVCKAPIAAGPGAGTDLYDIVPGHAEQSIVVYRMSSIEPEIMMPELGRSVVHVEGVALITDWINGIAGSCTTN